jgi:hypothetical protein
MPQVLDKVLRVGQEFIDEPIYVKPRGEHMTLIARSLRIAYGRKDQKPILVRHERVKLRWMKPSPDGKLIPR